MSDYRKPTDGELFQRYRPLEPQRPAQRPKAQRSFWAERSGPRTPLPQLRPLVLSIDEFTEEHMSVEEREDFVAAIAQATGKPPGSGSVITRLRRQLNGLSDQQLQRMLTELESRRERRKPLVSPEFRRA
jgi:hypothetical protein